MAERFNAAVLKTVDPKGPGVRIPLSPQVSDESIDFTTFSAILNKNPEQNPEQFLN
jgi:hypothetical protein